MMQDGHELDKEGFTTDKGQTQHQIGHDNPNPVMWLHTKFG